MSANESRLFDALGYKAKKVRDAQHRIWNERRAITEELHALKLLCKTHDVNFLDYCKHQGIEGALQYDLRV